MEVITDAVLANCIGDIWQKSWRVQSCHLHFTDVPVGGSTSDGV